MHVLHKALEYKPNREGDNESQLGWVDWKLEDVDARIASFETRLKMKTYDRHLNKQYTGTYRRIVQFAVQDPVLLVKNIAYLEQHGLQRRKSRKNKERNARPVHCGNASGKR